jgi:hypothetical protein
MMAEQNNLFAPSPTIFSTIPCPSPGCNRWFRNNGGLTKHTRARHLIAPQPQPERPDLAPWLFDDVPLPEDFDAPPGEGVPVKEDGEGFEWEHHPILCGTFSLSIFSTETLSGCFSQRRHATKSGNIFHAVLHRRHLQSGLQTIGRHITIVWILS